jgi:hypothetical protein
MCLGFCSNEIGVIEWFLLFSGILLAIYSSNLLSSTRNIVNVFVMSVELSFYLLNYTVPLVAQKKDVAAAR